MEGRRCDGGIPERASRHESGRRGQSGAGDPRMSQGGADGKGDEQQRRGSTGGRPPRPEPEAYVLMAGTVILGRHEEASGAESAAADLQIPPVVGAAEEHTRVTFPQPGDDTL